MSAKMFEPKSVEAVSADSILDQIEQVVRVNILDTIKLPAMKRIAGVATGMRTLRELMARPEVMAIFMPLQNSALGFQTDKKDGYSEAEVRDALIEGFLRGALPVNNEINIIAGRCYLTKSYFQRVTQEHPGVSRITYDVGVPAMSPNGALVPFRATWIQDGEEHTLIRNVDEATKMDTRIPVRVNSGMGADGITGKAIRKGLKAVYERMTGHVIDLPEGDVSEPTPANERAKSRIQSAIDSTKEKVA